MKALKHYLDSHESAPSACLMVKDAAGHEVSRDEQSSLYERSESSNDQERDFLLKTLTDAQLIGLYENILSILLEKVEYFEQEMAEGG